MTSEEHNTTAWLHQMGLRVFPELHTDHCTRWSTQTQLWFQSCSSVAVLERTGKKTQYWILPSFTTDGASSNHLRLQHTDLHIHLFQVLGAGLINFYSNNNLFSYDVYFEIWYEQLDDLNFHNRRDNHKNCWIISLRIIIFIRNTIDDSQLVLNISIILCLTRTSDDLARKELWEIRDRY